MVGPLSAAGTMCERMHAVHRWCVTGEQQCQCWHLCPLTSPALPAVTSSRCSLHISRSSAEASSSAVSLPLFCPQARLWEHTATSWLTCTPCCTLCSTSPLAVGLYGVVLMPRFAPHQPNNLAQIMSTLGSVSVGPALTCSAEAAAWRRMIADRIAGGEEGPAAMAAWQLLDHVLRPLMWRNTKSVVAQEFHLPHRTLRPTWLAFQAGERAFYEQVPAGLGVVGACLATEKLRQT